ncbi:MAG: DUF499 domain-containing protein [Candidatus Wallbacteria bacterium]
MKPWREVIVPHPDVLEGIFQQSEFAADITAVHTGKASHEYQNSEAFFQRTFITEGMRLLLISVANRLNGRGGDPVIQLQTAFGGGKTHTMLAVYHLAKRECKLTDLAGIIPVLESAGLKDVPKAHVAVIDGTALSPGQEWKRGKKSIKTLWGELAWQLGGDDGYHLVKQADENGTSPGKDMLKTLLEKYSPCVILIDELVAYIRQFQDGKPISGGTYDSNLSFVQALTEAIKLVPTAVILASLPESEVEAGSNRGIAALKALEKTFGRIQALWKPVATEEAFEIVRRRLFETSNNKHEIEETCRAFADMYVKEGVKMPSETHESRYYDRLVRAYPIHPEVFDRLYEDWTTLEGFQRTRGVLKLMAKVIYRLWKDQNPDFMIMPGSLPLYDGSSRNELTYYLQAGWDAVFDCDIDGEKSESAEIDTKEPRFGAIHAARRVARTVFFGSAPAAGGTHKGIKGLDRARILLGCLQPHQNLAVFSDSLMRLAGRLHYLNSSGDVTLDATRFWFDTRANLRREMEDRKGRFDRENELRLKIAGVLKKMTGGGSTFEGVHIFTANTDLPDDEYLRLVFLPPGKFFSKQESRFAFTEIHNILKQNGTKPRYHCNRLLFVVPDQSSNARMIECARIAMAWNSIVEDIHEGRLNIDKLQENQAKKELQTAEDVLTRAVRECYKWLLCPVMLNPTDHECTIENYLLNSGAHDLMKEIEKVCKENELVISAWAPTHLREYFYKFYWKDGRTAYGAINFWEDAAKYLYLPRLKDRNVLENALRSGVGSKDYFGIAYGQNGDKFEGFSLGSSFVQLDDSLLLIEPSAAKKYDDSHQEITLPPTHGTDSGSDPEPAPIPPQPQLPSAKTFIGSAVVNAATARRRMTDIADEIISILGQDPNAEITITVEIKAEYPNGAPDHIKRAVSENANTLGFKNNVWE